MNGSSLGSNFPVEDNTGGMLRVATIWRRDLVNVNKTRDNHLARFGKYFDHVLFVCSEREIGSHVGSHGTDTLYLSGGNLGFLGFWFKTILKLRKMNQEKKIDAVILPIGEEPLVYAVKWFVRGNEGRPRIVLDMWDVPGLVVDGGDKSLFKRMARVAYLRLLPRMLKNADVIVAGVVKTPFLNMGIPAEKIIPSENGINLEYFKHGIGKSDMWDALPISETTIKVLYQGYLHESRGSERMIKSIMDVRAAGFDAQLLLVGPSTPDARDRIVGFARAFGIEKYVQVAGEVRSDRVPSIVAGADLCLCPMADIEKYRWNYPVKIYEYFAMKKPVIASDLPGISSLIEHDKIGGSLYDPNDPDDPDDMTKKIINLIGDPGLREQLALAGHQFVLTKQWDAQVEKLAMRLTHKLKGMTSVG